jgi:selenocysteine lyase/cysteine desulfurase
MPDAEKLAAVRDGLPAVGAGIYLNTPVCGPLPAETARAMADIADWELATGRAHRDRPEDVATRLDEARASLAAIVGADVDAIVLTHGIADSLRRAVHAIDWRPGDRALVIATSEALAGEALRPPVVDAEVDVVEMPVEPDSAGDEELLAAALASIQPATRLLLSPHVSPIGRVLPVERIAAIAHDAGAVLVVDGGHAAGAIPVAVDLLGADVYVMPGWRWLLGPEGISGMAVSGPVRERLASSPAGGDVHLPSVVGLARSCGWLSMYVGLEWIFERSAALAATTRARLASIPGVRVLTPDGYTAPTIAFRIAGWDASAALEELGSRVFALASVLPDVGAIRIGSGFFNTEEELDRFATAVELLATHTPDSLPPRRQLTIIGGDR